MVHFTCYSTLLAVGRLKVLLQAPSFDEMEKKFTHIMLGGRFKPKDCLARHRVAILIPYRDREDHLRVFLYNMHQMLPRQQIDYGIFVIEEVGVTAKIFMSFPSVKRRVLVFFSLT